MGFGICPVGLAWAGALRRLVCPKASTAQWADSAQECPLGDTSIYAIPPEWGHHIAGFIDGEGCFQVRIDERYGNRACKFTLGLRADDGDFLRQIRDVCGGIGALYYTSNLSTRVTNSKPQLIWEIQSKADALALVAILERFPLRSKKRRDFDTWREALAAYLRRDYVEMKRLGDVLREGRRYSQEPFVPPEPEWEQLPLTRGAA